MNFIPHTTGKTRIAEISSDKVILKTTRDGLDLLGNLYYQDFEKVIIHKAHITPDFFDLKNGIAGEILQKFSNYWVRLAIVGDFSHPMSKSLRDFIYESNQRKQIVFVSSVAEGLKILSQ
ncbi:MAG: DUF4180 domain-containing protein [Bacteroidales bacterium]|jgi:hypothetical protein|nr:DUF4180 domain-containing protein [Bacteroidales bacterium]